MENLLNTSRGYPLFWKFRSSVHQWEFGRFKLLVESVESGSISIVLLFNDFFWSVHRRSFFWLRVVFSSSRAIPGREIESERGALERPFSGHQKIEGLWKN